MAEDNRLTDAMAGVKPEIRPRMEEAVAAVIALAWAYRRNGFSYNDVPTLNAEANAILSALSDGNLTTAEMRARRLLETVGMGQWDEEALEYAAREIDGEDVLWRFDMQASHLKEIIAGWLTVAAVAGFTEEETARNLWIYLRDPSRSAAWREAGLPKPSWGKGYMMDTLEGMTLIAQDYVNRTYQYATIQRYKALGARFYRTRRNSGFHCPLCDEMAERIWPVEVVVLPYHPRCVCVAEPVYDDEL